MYPNKPPTYSLADVTIVINFFYRLDLLKECIRRIRSNHPSIKIIVFNRSGLELLKVYPDAKEDFEFVRHHPQVTLINLPYNHSEANIKNYLLQDVTHKTPLIFYCDESIHFTPKSKLDHLLDIINYHDADVVSGCIADSDDYVYATAANITYELDENNNFKIIYLVDPSELVLHGNKHEFKKVDYVTDFYLFKTEVLAQTKWDENLQPPYDDIEFFTKLKQRKCNVVVTPSFIVRKENKTKYKLYYSITDVLPEKPYFQVDIKTKGYKTYIPLGSYFEEPRIGRPDIVVLTTGYSGSRVIVKLLSLLGYKIPDLDDEIQESSAVLKWVSHYVKSRSKRGDLHELESIISTWPRPWVFKDPKTTPFLEDLMFIFEKYKPLLIVNRKQEEDITNSWKNKEDANFTKFERFKERLESIDKVAAYWPWDKIELSYEDIRDFVKWWDRPL
jgi:hypothetical protein